MARREIIPDWAKSPSQSPITAFWDSLKRDGLSASTAQFKDPEVESRYNDHLVETALASDLMFWAASIVSFFSYAILDVFTVQENLEQVLLIRLVFGLVMIALAVPIMAPRFKRHFSWLTASGLFTCAVGIITMIAIIPPEGAPPYIIGVLVAFIASSCLMRIPFRLASSVYITSSLIYSAVLTFGPDFSRTDIIAGHFFMVSIVLVAVFTNYTQEIRSRMIWMRDEQRQRDAQTIEKLLIEATAADQSKINFLSMMSHELRTPLHQIIGYTEVVTNACKAANDDDQNVHHLNEIHGSAHELLSRIQKMLRFASATAGKMKYETERMPVQELIDASAEQMRTALEGKSITINEDGLSRGAIRIDLVHTCYALNNILENAIEASSEGATIWVSGKEDEDGAYNLIIRDEGQGMSAEQIEKALKPFTQGEDTLARSREGIGLGLTLANKIFTDQNASITLESASGEGVTVTIKFPSAAAESRPEQAAS